MKNNSRENEFSSNDSAVIHEPRSVSHTKGPWSACKGDKGGCQCGYIFGHGGNVYVAQALNEWNVDELGPDPYPTLETGLANARLIAAAPEMLSSLRELLDIITEHDKLQYAKGSPIDRTVTRARQIIAKAEGKP